MKIAILVGDGMGDYPVDELKGLTPLQASDSPILDQITFYGEARMVDTVPKDLPPGSDVANLALMGYDASKNYTGRAAIEAAGADIKMKDNDVALRCNLVTVINEEMHDYSAGHISTNEAKELISSLQKELGNENFTFHCGVQYRHLLIWNNGSVDYSCTPPHEISDKKIHSYIPSGNDSKTLIDLMEKSKSIFINHPINKKREAEGKLPATQIWLWGQGKSMQLESYQKLYNLNGGIISAVDLLKGLAKLAGLKAPNILGATGFIDTNYKGKVESAINILSKDNFVYLHIEAPDECGHLGDAYLKKKAIELFDNNVCRPMLEWLENCGEDYLLVLCMDHRTPVALKGHTSDPVPMVALKGPIHNLEKQKNFDEFINNGVSQGMAYTWIQQLLNEASKKIG